MIQNDLQKVGIAVNLVPIESKALLSRVSETLDYEAGLFSIVLGDADPSTQMDILPSHGTMHWWNPSQPRPSTDWENQIDQLMARQQEALDRADRKRIFDEVQQIMVEQSPFLYLVARDLVVAARAQIGNLKPSIIPNFLLWNSEELYRK